MQPKPTWHHHIKTLFPTLSVAYIPTLGLLLIAALQSKVPLQYLTRDPSAIMEAPPYIGLLSNIGILLWCSCAAVCIFSYAVLRKDASNREWALFFLLAGLITSVMLLDDFFLFHEAILRAHFHVPEEVPYAVYGVAVLVQIVRFRTTILETDFPLLFLALVFFGISIVADLAYPESSANYLLEDGSKILGIVGWFTYFSRECVNQVERTVLHRQADIYETSLKG
jgi:hypothetical protein